MKRSSGVGVRGVVDDNAPPTLLRLSLKSPCELGKELALPLWGLFIGFQF